MKCTEMKHLGDLAKTMLSFLTIILISEIFNSKLRERVLRKMMQYSKRISSMIYFLINLRGVGVFKKIHLEQLQS
jgi:amino acid permease